jgi:hypothetical protein
MSWRLFTHGAVGFPNRRRPKGFFVRESPLYPRNREMTHPHTNGASHPNDHILARHLVEVGLLDEERRDDPSAIEAALNKLYDPAKVAMAQMPPGPDEGSHGVPPKALICRNIAQDVLDVLLGRKSAQELRAEFILTKAVAEARREQPLIHRHIVHHAEMVDAVLKTHNKTIDSKSIAVWQQR